VALGGISGGDFNSNNIRVVTIEDQPWFLVNDIMDTLGFAKNPTNGSYANHLTRLGPDAVRTHMLPTKITGRGDGPSRKQFIVSESGLYLLIMRSSRPQARAFQDWVTREVLPSIRKTGAYVEGQPSRVRALDAAPPGRPLWHVRGPGKARVSQHFRTTPRPLKSRHDGRRRTPYGAWLSALLGG